MTTGTTFTSRVYRGEPDLEPVWELFEASEAVDKLDHSETLDDLRLYNSMPDLDPERNFRVWEDAQGKIVGFARIDKPGKNEDTGEVSTRATFRIHPLARNQGLEQEILDWTGSQLRETGAEIDPEAKIVLYVGLPDFYTYGRDVLEKAGFQPARYFFRMVRSLTEPIPDPVFPEGYTLSYVKNNDEELQEWVDCFNESFIDHWNFHPTNLEEARHWNDASVNYKPESDLVAVAPDGKFAAFCYCEVNDEDNRRNDRNDGWIHLLGTRRGHRNKGLGRAMLYAGFRRLKSLGADTAKLGVDADNPTGALGLYERVGFHTDVTRIIYSKEV